MPLKLPMAWVIALNVAGWPLIHLGIAWIFLRFPDRAFASAGSRWLKPRPAEEFIYLRVLRVPLWKSFLPDGAPWLRGFPKTNLRESDPAYLRKFIVETRRGEAAHWMMLVSASLFFLWNPPWADAVIVLYAIFANVPCIVTQRYNRLRLERIEFRPRRHPTEQHR